MAETPSRDASMFCFDRIPTPSKFLSAGGMATLALAAFAAFAAVVGCSAAAGPRAGADDLSSVQTGCADRCESQVCKSAYADLAAALEPQWASQAVAFVGLDRIEGAPAPGSGDQALLDALSQAWRDRKKSSTTSDFKVNGCFTGIGNAGGATGRCPSLRFLQRDVLIQWMVKSDANGALRQHAYVSWGSGSGVDRGSLHGVDFVKREPLPEEGMMVSVLLNGQVESTLLPAEYGALEPIDRDRFSAALHRFVGAAALSKHGDLKNAIQPGRLGSVTALSEAYRTAFQRRGDFTTAEVVLAATPALGALLRGAALAAKIGAAAQGLSAAVGAGAQWTVGAAVAAGLIPLSAVSTSAATAAAPCDPETTGPVLLARQVLRQMLEAGKAADPLARLAAEVIVAGKDPGISRDSARSIAVGVLDEATQDYGLVIGRLLAVTDVPFSNESPNEIARKIAGARCEQLVPELSAALVRLNAMLPYASTLAAPSDERLRSGGFNPELTPDEILAGQTYNRGSDVFNSPLRSGRTPHRLTPAMDSLIDKFKPQSGRSAGAFLLYRGTSNRRLVGEDADGSARPCTVVMDKAYTSTTIVPGGAANYAGTQTPEIWVVLQFFSEAFTNAGLQKGVYLDAVPDLTNGGEGEFVFARDNALLVIDSQFQRYRGAQTRFVQMVRLK